MSTLPVGHFKIFMLNLFIIITTAVKFRLFARKILIALSISLLSILGLFLIGLSLTLLQSYLKCQHKRAMTYYSMDEYFSLLEVSLQRPST